MKKMIDPLAYSDQIAQAFSICGSKSGRDMDKIKYFRVSDTITLNQKIHLRRRIKYGLVIP